MTTDASADKLRQAIHEALETAGLPVMSDERLQRAAAALVDLSRLKMREAGAGGALWAVRAVELEPMLNVYVTQAASAEEAERKARSGEAELESSAFSDVYGEVQWLKTLSVERLPG